jgi:bifunctional DNA-binding transcriptional regulator/antitoxin component of YhaV-PrlF toxin-antitoxin module
MRVRFHFAISLSLAPLRKSYLFRTLSDELFDESQAVREKMARTFKTERTMRTYVLHDRVYCARCIANKPLELVDEHYGKMRPGWNPSMVRAYYRCLARDRGYHECGQCYVAEELIDEQVVNALSQLVIPDGFRERVEAAVRSRVENAANLARMEELKAIVERINFSWENGFLNPEEYLEKRTQLQKEMEAMRPIDYDELMEAADLIQNFAKYWTQCAEVEKPAEARQQLLAKIVNRVFVYDREVVAIALHGDFGIVLNSGGDTIPKEVIGEISKVIKKGENTNENVLTQDGSDGLRTRAGLGTVKK